MKESGTREDGENFSVHSGRNAFRGKKIVASDAADFDGIEMDELRRQQLAMRSFTDSVDVDAPPPPLSDAANYNNDFDTVIKVRSISGADIANSAATDVNFSSYGRSSGDGANDAAQQFAEIYDSSSAERRRRSSVENQLWRGGRTNFNGGGDDDDDDSSNLDQEALSNASGGGMRASSTVDTIIEVVKANAAVEDTSPVAKEALGETQKYVMTVPGPGHLEQEMELHASLLKHDVAAAASAADDGSSPDELGGKRTAAAVSQMSGSNLDDDYEEEEFALEAELKRVTAMAEAAENAFRKSAHATRQNENQASIRDEYSRIVASRPRPTTPTTSCVSEGDGVFFANFEKYAKNSDTFVKASTSFSSSSLSYGGANVCSHYGEDASNYGDVARMRVSIPSNHTASPHGKRRSTILNATDANVTPRWKTDTTIDLLETNPEYARNAPRKPVVHRRTSVEWENFTTSADDDANAAASQQQKDVSYTNNANAAALDVAADSGAAEQKKADEIWNDNAPSTVLSSFRTNDNALRNGSDLFADEWANSMNKIEASTNDATQSQHAPPSALNRFIRETTTPPSSPITINANTPEQNRKASKHLAEDVTSRFDVMTNASDENPFRSAEEFGERTESALLTETQPTLSGDASSGVLPTTSIAPVRAAPPPPPSKKSSIIAKATVDNEAAATTAAYASQTQQQYADDGRRNPEEYGQYSTEIGATNPYEEGTTYDASVDPQQPYDSAQLYDNAYNYGDYSQSAQPYDSQNYNTTLYNHGSADVSATTNPFETYNYDSSGQEFQQYGGYGTQYDQSNPYGMTAAAAYDASADYDTSTNAYGTAINAYGTSADAYSTSADTYADPSATYDQYAGYGTDYSSYGAPMTAAYDGVQAAYDETQQYQSTLNDPAANLQYDETSQQQYGTVTVNASIYGHEPNLVEPTPLEPAPPAPSLLGPLLPPQRARTPDPFSWEAQANAYETLGTAVAPPRPPPLSPSPLPSPTSRDDAADGGGDSGAELVDSQTPTVEGVEVRDTSKSSPPLRPKPPPMRPPAPSPSRPPTLPSLTGASNNKAKKEVEEDEEEDPWARFNKMSAQASSAIKSGAEQLKNLSENTAANEIKDESYLAQVGGSQAFELNAAQKQILQMQQNEKKQKAEKKRQKAAGKRAPSPTFDPSREADVERQAAELVKKMVATHADLADWKPPTSTEEMSGRENIVEEEKKFQAEENKANVVEEPPPNSFADFSSLEANETTASKSGDFAVAEAEAAEKSEPEAPRTNWADFGVSNNNATLPSSDSDFFAKVAAVGGVNFGEDEVATAAQVETEDPFAPTLIEDSYDPFSIRPAEEIIAEARKRAEIELDATEFATIGGRLSASRLSSPTPEGGSPASSRPTGFDDDFRVERGEYSHTPTPLYDEDDSQPLVEFLPAFRGDGWELTLRHPLKKKIMADRFWKPCFVRIQDNTVLIFNERGDSKAYHEILLQTSYSLSDTTLQAYDAYGKIHTVKLQHILYKERVGIRPGQISRLVEGHVTKYGLPLEHAAQATVLAKFGSLNEDVLSSFVHCVEDILFKCKAKRQTSPIYKQDEVQVHCYDEYTAHVDRNGIVSDQRARVRFFCLAFLSGSPYIEIGLNDRRREGKEIVRRKDILPMYTERWIRFEGIEFHNTVEESAFEEDQLIRLQPPDGCFFEVMRFRVRPPKNREKPLTVKAVMKIAGSKVEISVKTMAAAQTQRARGTIDSTRVIPCEDIQIRIPIPEAWIYIFREERHWGVGSVHSKTRRTGKVKNLRDRLMGTVQHTEPTLIEVAIGEAKYEHVFRALVWRIPRLPEKHHDAYKTHLLKCRFELSSFDLMPDTFQPCCDIDFTMPLATISNTVIRSVAIEQHEDSDRVEKFVRYVAKCHYKLDVDYIHCNDLDEELANASKIQELDALAGPTEPAKHVAAFNPDEVKAQHAGYGIDFASNRPLADEWSAQNGGDSGGAIELQGYGDTTATINGGKAKNAHSSGGFGAFAADEYSSSDEDEDEKSKKVPMVEINMQGYGY